MATIEAADYTLHTGDCLDVMATMPDASVDAIITDPPYGTTACKWDSVIPFEPMWAQLKRIIKPRGAIVLFGSEPFSSLLRTSNLDWYKYDWVWKKSLPIGFFHAKNKPLNSYETVCVFSEGSVSHKGNYQRMTYNPIMRTGTPYKKKQTPGNRGQAHNFNRPSHKEYTKINSGNRFPVDVISFSNGNNNTVHPTQKPVDLMSYLIRTYTNEGETVLDFTMGSGTTGVAAMQTGRKFIGVELDADYFAIAKRRIHEAANPLQPALMEAAD